MNGYDEVVEIDNQLHYVQGRSTSNEAYLHMSRPLTAVMPCELPVTTGITTIEDASEYLEGGGDVRR